MTLSLHGVFPPVPTIFDNDGDLDLDGFASNLERWNHSRLAGYVVLGSNGEFPLLDRDEKIALVERARKVASADKIILAGTGAESLRATLDLTRRAADVGADAALVLTPSYFNLNPAQQVAFFLQVADASPIPVLVYNMPLYAKVDLPAQAIIEAARHPNIIGYKESGPNIVKIAEVASAAPSHFKVLAGSASYLYPAMAVGAVGAIAGMANVAPDQTVALYEAVRDGDLTEARALHDRLLEPNAAITSRFGIAGMKAAVDLTGGRGGSPRAPLQPLSDADKAILSSVLDRAGLVAAAARA